MDRWLREDNALIRRSFFVVVDDPLWRLLHSNKCQPECRSFRVVDRGERPFHDLGGFRETALQANAYGAS